MDRHKKSTGLWSCLPALIIIVTFIGFIAASGVLAQQISSGNGNRFSEAFFGQDLYFFNLLSGYPYNHSLFPTYNGFFSPSLLSFSGSGSGSGGLESYGNYVNGGVYDPYYSSFSQIPYGNSLPSASFSATGSLGGRLDAGVYIGAAYSWPGVVLSSPWALDPGFSHPAWDRAPQAFTARFMAGTLCLLAGRQSLPLQITATRHPLRRNLPENGKAGN